MTLEDKTVAFAKERKYHGFYNGKFYYGSMKTASFTTLWKALGLSDPNVLSELEDKELAFHLLSASKDILKYQDLFTKVPFIVYESHEREIFNGNKELIMNTMDKVSVLYDVDSTTNPEPFFYDDDTREVYNIPKEFYFARKGITEAQAKQDPNNWGKIIYNPFDSRRVIEVESTTYKGKLKALNSARAYFWADMDVEAKLPDLFLKILHILFITQESREFVLDWMANSLTGRCETVFAMIGKKGIGKSILAEMLGALFHKDQFQYVGDSLLTDKFNAQMANARLLVMEEVDIKDTESSSTIKRLLNEYIPLEKKGVDAVTVANQTSFILCSNNKNMGFEPSDRRFSVPEMTEIPLKRQMSEEEISNLMEMLRGDSDEKKLFCAQLGHYLKNRVVKYSRTTPYKGKYFYSIAYFSLTEWQQGVIEYWETHGEIGVPVTPSDMVKVMCPEVNTRIHPKTFESFVDEYRHLGEYRIGKVVPMKRRGKPTIGLLVDSEFFRVKRQEYQDRLAAGEVVYDDGEGSRNAFNRKIESDSDLL